MLFKEDFEIKTHTSFKIGGEIAKIYFPEDLDEFLEVLKKEPEAVVIGNLSNTLVSSFGYDGVVISTSKLNNIEVNDKKIIAQCGVKGPKLSQIALENNLSGLEFLIGFPGSVGGEVYMNAGASGQTISDNFACAKIYSPQGIITLDKEKMEFGYRKSVCQSKKYIVLEAEFDLKHAKYEDIKNKMDENLEFRRNHQPLLSLPNCGSIFKNPPNNSAGKLLDECGAKNLKIGGARVWENHANFIVNSGNATSLDVLKLMCEMKSKVKKLFNVDLIPEIKYIGNNKEEEDLCKILKVK